MRRAVVLRIRWYGVLKETHEAVTKLTSRDGGVSIPEQSYENLMQSNQQVDNTISSLFDVELNKRKKSCLPNQTFQVVKQIKPLRILEGSNKMLCTIIYSNKYCISPTVCGSD